MLKLSWLAIVLLLTVETAIAQGTQVALHGSATISSPFSCIFLSRFFPNQVTFPTDEAYRARQAQYWSAQQGSLEPICRFTPHGAADVQLAVNHLILAKTSFAVESGGHSSDIGASNIAGGVVVDLERLESITLTDDGEAVWLEPGARWSEVYAKLEKHNLTVSGGRVGRVGVGGYVLGGGFSWFANQNGWACDSVTEFEIVTPARKILRANSGENEDLFWALKGSLGAFGIVTKIKLPTIARRTVYGGALSYDQDHVPAVFAALQHLNTHPGLDPHSQAYVSFAWLQRYQKHASSVYLLNTEGSSTAPGLVNLSSISHIGSSLRNMTLRESADELAASNPLGPRRVKITLTAVSTKEAMHVVHTAYLKASSTLHFQGDGMLGVSIQPLTLSHLRAGGNIFALNNSPTPLLLLSAEIWWADEAVDQYYEEAAEALHAAWTEGLKARGLLHGWVYPNYAAKWQQPFGEESIGNGARLALASVRRKYDPDDLWRAAVPGIWHI